MSRIVLDALAMPDLAEHFQIEAGALLDALRFHQLALADKFLDALGQLDLDRLHRRQHLLARRHVMTAGVDGKARDLLPDAPGQGVKQLQALDLVVKQLDADGHLGVLGRKNVDGVAAHTEGAARKIDVVALVLHAHQLRNHVALAHFVARAQRHHHLVVRLGLADAVNGRHRGHDHHVAALQHAFGAAQAHLLDVLVDGGIFLDEQITLRHIGLRLVVIVVTDEVLNGVFREKFAELAVQLRRQRLVGRKHNGRPSQAGDHIGHGEGLARARHAQQRLEHLTIVDAFDQLVDGLGLVAGGRIGLVQLERRAGVAHEGAGALGLDGIVCSQGQGFRHSGQVQNSNQGGDVIQCARQTRADQAQARTSGNGCTWSQRATSAGSWKVRTVSKAVCACG